MPIGSLWARIGQRLSTWGQKSVAIIKRSGNFFTRVANRLRITPAARWVAATSTTAASKVWPVVRAPLVWVGVPIAAVVATPAFSAFLLFLVALNTLGLSWDVRRLRRDVNRLRVDLDVVDTVYVDPDYVSDEDEYEEVEYEEEPVDEVEEELVEEVEEVVETASLAEIVATVIKEMRLAEIEEEVEEQVLASELVIGEELVYGSDDPADETDMSAVTTSFALNGPVLEDETIQSRVVLLDAQNRIAQQNEDADLFSETLARMYLIEIRNGQDTTGPRPKLKRDSTASAIYRQCRKNCEVTDSTFPWNWVLMNRATQNEAKRYKEITRLAKLREEAS